MDAVPGSSSDNEIRFSRKEIYNMVKNHLNDGLTIILQHLEEQLFEKSGYNIKINDANMKTALTKLFCLMRQKWKAVRRIEERFYTMFDKWLQVTIAFRLPEAARITTSHKSGRQQVGFSHLSERSKRRKTEEIRSICSSEELCYASQMSLRASGNLDASKVIKDVTSASPSRATKYRKCMKVHMESTLFDNAALSVMIEYKLSKNTYLGLRSVSKENNCQLYPSYERILEAKQRCYPDRADIFLTEYSAEIKLQALLNLTVARILLAEKNGVEILTAEQVSNMTLICKWGCDGSSGQSEYKQRFSTEDKSDCSIFLTSLVPIKLLCDAQKTTVWKNPRTSSPRFCRPIRLQFVREDTEVTNNEVTYIEKQIEELVPFKTIIHGKEIIINFKLALTMIDGKICNAISSTKSTQRCYLCGATSKQFNSIDVVLNRQVNEKICISGYPHCTRGFDFLNAACIYHIDLKLRNGKQAQRKTKKKWKKGKKLYKRVSVYTAGPYR